MQNNDASFYPEWCSAFPLKIMPHFPPRITFSDQNNVAFSPGIRETKIMRIDGSRRVISWEMRGILSRRERWSVKRSRKWYLILFTFKGNNSSRGDADGTKPGSIKKHLRKLEEKLTLQPDDDGKVRLTKVFERDVEYKELYAGPGWMRRWVGVEDETSTPPDLFIC